MLNNSYIVCCITILPIHVVDFRLRELFSFTQTLLVVVDHGTNNWVLNIKLIPSRRQNPKNQTFPSIIQILQQIEKRIDLLYKKKMY